MDELHLLATDGIVSAAAARQAGAGPLELRAMVRAGTALRLVRGWYALRDPDTGTAPWEGSDRHDTERRRHRLRTVALVRSFDGRVCAAHHSALVLRGVATWRSDLDVVHLARTADDHTRHRRGAVIHPDCGLPPVAVDGCDAVPTAVAVVDVGLHPLRGGEPASPIESLVTADSALHLGLTTLPDLQDAVRRRQGHPGIRAVRRLLEHSDGRHESVGETRLAHAMRLLGHPTTPQFPCRVGGHDYRADLRVNGTFVLLEFDGMTKYLPDSPSAADLLAARRLLAAEKQRQDEITEDGAEFVRVTWAQLDDLPGLDRRVRAAIDRSERRGA